MELSTAWKLLRHHGEHSAYLGSQARYRCLCAGRGSGKTEISKREVVMSLPQPDPRPIGDQDGQAMIYVVAGPTQKQAKKIWWSDLCRMIPKPWVKSINLSELTIYCEVNGQASEVMVMGLDAPERLEGKHNYRHFWIDEYSDCKPGTFEHSIMPTLNWVSGGVTFLGVPKRYGRNAVEYRDYCERGVKGRSGLLEFDEWATFTWPSWEVIDKEKIDKIKERLDSKSFAEIYGAEWVTAGGTCFYGFDEKRNVRPTPYDPAKPILLACDFNVDPLCWTLSHTDGKVIYTFAEIVLSNTNTQAAMQFLSSRFGSHKAGWHLFGDSAGKARHTSASSSDYAQIINHVISENGKQRRALQPLTVRVPESAPAIKDRLASCNSLLCSTAGVASAFIDPSCSFLIHDFKNRPIDEMGKPSETKESRLGHISDAWGYMVHQLFPATILQIQQTVSIHDKPVIS